jgi:hypothetical protein
MRAVYALFGFGLSENSTTEPALSDKGTASDTMSSGARNLRVCGVCCCGCWCN